jgi:general secretion pathway protein A
MDLRHAFGLSREPFSQDLKIEELYAIPGLSSLVERFQYAVRLGLVMVVTGEVGTGKSTSLRFASSKLHPAEYRILSVIATTGTLLDLLRQICLEVGSPSGSSLAVLTKMVRELLIDIRQKKQVPLLVIDEAQLLRLDVFAQLHTLTQFHFDSQSLMPIILCGQNGILDRLLFHTSRPFASRVVGRSHLEALKLQDMQGYLAHHLQLAGGADTLLSDEAMVAVHQGSGGLLRRANSLARGGMIAAAREGAAIVSAEHIRLASTEIL